MFNVLQARGVPSKLLVFPDENHVRNYTIERLDDERQLTLNSGC